MRRVYRLAALVLIVGLVGGCFSPYVAPDPYPYSFSNPDKHPYPRTVSGAQEFIQDATDLGDYDGYPHWKYVNNNYVQSPILSERLRSGDCDDYAVMMAYYLQEYWGYDTFIIFLDMGYGEDDHAVAFVRNSTGLIDTSQCSNGYPYLTLYSADYVPLDWIPCPNWMWRKYGGSIDYLPPIYSYDVTTGHLAVFDEGAFAEWYELVNLALGEKPGNGTTWDSIPAERTNVGGE